METTQLWHNCVRGDVLWCCVYVMFWLCCLASFPNNCRFAVLLCSALLSRSLRGNYGLRSNVLLVYFPYQFDPLICRPAEPILYDSAPTYFAWFSIFRVQCILCIFQFKCLDCYVICTNVEWLFFMSISIGLLDDRINFQSFFMRIVNCTTLEYWTISTLARLRIPNCLLGWFAAIVVFFDVGIYNLVPILDILNNVFGHFMLFNFAYIFASTLAPRRVFISRVAQAFIASDSVLCVFAFRTKYIAFIVDLRWYHFHVLGLHWYHFTMAFNGDYIGGTFAAAMGRSHSAGPSTGQAAGSAAGHTAENPFTIPDARPLTQPTMTGPIPMEGT